MINIDVETDGIKKYLDQKIREVKPRVVKELYFRLVARTPVKTGRARFSWDVTDSSFKSPLPEGQYPYPSIPTIPKTDNDIYVYNPLDYIEALNEGSSRQAPPMFVELAVWDTIFRNRSSVGVA